MAVVTTNLGTVTAYGDAVAAGYTGTKEQWQALMADYATVGQQASQSAQTASTAATTATTAAQTATTKAGEASASATAASQAAASIGTPDTTLTQSGKAADAKVTGDKISEIKENLSDLENQIGGMSITWKDGYYIKANGDEQSYGVYSCTDYIQIYGDAGTLRTRVNQNSAYLAIAYYDKDKTFISGIYNESTTTQIFDGTVEIPQNAVYARCSCYTSYIESFVFELEGFVGAILDELEDINERMSAVDDLSELEETVEQNSVDITANTEAIAQLSGRFDGAEETDDLTKIAGLNFSSGATAYTTTASYDTWYAPVKAGVKYTFEFLRGTKNVTLRTAFAEQLPAKDVPATQLDAETVVRTASYTYEFTPTVSGYFSVSAYRNDLDTGTLSITSTIEGVIPMIESVADDVENVRVNGLTVIGKQNLYFAEESLEQASTQVQMTSKTVIPYDDVEIYVVCPDNICVWFELQKTPYDTTVTNTDYVGNGDSIKLSAGQLYKAHFAYATKTDGAYVLTGDTLLLADFVKLIDEHKVMLLYAEKDVVTNNKDSEKMLRALIGAGNAVISHISDTHGDGIRYGNFMDMSRYIGVTCAINSGDVVNNHVGDGYAYLLSAIDKYPDVSTIFCIGNHDAVSLNATAYDRYYKYFDDAYDYAMATSNVYYYKDYTDYNLRVISLDIYEERHNGSNCCISSDQINWLIATLASTPANYGVIIVAHSSENFVDKVTGYDKFYSDGITSDWTNRYSNVIGNPVAKIVDAFISKTSVTDSYEQTILTEAEGSSTTVETVSYSADFTNVPATAEFIAYINGHKHKDMVGYLNDTTNKQLTLNVTHGCTSAYYADQDDFPRANGKGSVQDAFNIYAIDRTNKTVKIFRIGSNVKYDLTMRDYMVIPYAD